MSSPRDLAERMESAVHPSGCVLQEVGGGALTGNELVELSGRAARELRSAGVRAGDLVLARGLRGRALFLGLLGTWSCDAAAVAVEAPLAPAELEAMVRDLRAAFLLERDAAGRLSCTKCAPRGGRLPAGTAMVKLTSGSTGTSRGIAVGAAHLLADGRQVIAGMGIRPEDVNVAAIPMAHSYGLGNLIMPLILQGTALRLVEDPLPEPLRRALSGGESLVFPGVPALFDMLALLPEGREARFPGLRLCLSAGAPLRAATAASFRRRFGLPVRTFYGASESGGIAYDASEAGLAAEQEEGCVGTPLPGVEIRLEGEEGRIAVKSAAVASGYLEDGTGRPGGGEFRGGEFLTGDTGRIDAQGRLVLTGRIGALVNVAGRKVNPLEVEALLRRLPGVADAAVLGVPDEARGESLVACLVARPEVTRETIMSRLRQDLTAYKLPRRIVFLEAIPRTERGKIDRAALLRRAGDPGASDLRR